MLRLLILTARNAPQNITSTHSIIQNLSHIDSARSEWFGRAGMGMNLHQRCLRVQSMWDTVGHWYWTCQHNLWLFLKTCSLHTGGMSTSPESWQMLQGVYLGFPTRPQFDIQLGDLKKSCCISQHLAESARKHRACQGENKTLMIEDRRR